MRLVQGDHPAGRAVTNEQVAHGLIVGVAGPARSGPAVDVAGQDEGHGLAVRLGQLEQALGHAAVAGLAATGATSVEWRHPRLGSGPA